MELFTDRSLDSDRIQILGTVNYSAPSNIALVKYWGKKGRQLPQNPSLSLTLSQSRTFTSLYFQGRSYLKELPNIEFEFFEEVSSSFSDKTMSFLKDLTSNELPYLKYFDLKIASRNNFPHSSGIASSASSMAALAMGLRELHLSLFPELKTYELYEGQIASYLSRLGSGSACRSIQGPFCQWGLEDSGTGNDTYAVKLTDIHEEFDDVRDSILIIDSKKKSVSSTTGHSLMNDHPYSLKRYNRARTHLTELKRGLASGDWDRFIEIVEAEALELHALMMCSQPSYILMSPNTLRAIELIREFRGRTKLRLCFTLDAGANVHLLYAGQDEKAVGEFIKAQLISLCEDGWVIHDTAGTGARAEVETLL